MQHGLIICVLGSCVLLSSRPIAAQRFAVDSSSESSLDSAITAAARRAGRDAADGQGTGARFAAGFVGGFLLGAFGPDAISDQQHLSIGVSALGLLLVVGAGTTSDTLPPARQRAEVAASGEAYQRVYRESYAREVKQRRGTAALTGAVVGFPAGLAAVYMLISSIGT